MGDAPFTCETPHKRPVTRKMSPFDDVIMCNFIYLPFILHVSPWVIVGPWASGTGRFMEYHVITNAWFFSLDSQWSLTKQDPIIQYRSLLGSCIYRADSRLAPSQWHTPLQSNTASHWRRPRNSPNIHQVFIYYWKLSGANSHQHNCCASQAWAKWSSRVMGSII